MERGSDARDDPPFLRPIALRAEGTEETNGGTDGKFKFELPSNSRGIGDWGFVRGGQRSVMRALLGQKSGPFRLQSINGASTGRGAWVWFRLLSSKDYIHLSSLMSLLDNHDSRR